MNKLVFNLVSTQKGWLIRQTMKWAAVGGTALTTWLVTKGVPITDSAALTAALSTLSVGLVEFALSKIASKIEAK